MQITASRWGNSLGVRIPKDIAEEVGLSAGASLDIEARGDQIVLSLRRHRYRLEDLLDWDNTRGDAGRLRLGLRCRA